MYGGNGGKTVTSDFLGLEFCLLIYFSFYLLLFVLLLLLLFCVFTNARKLKEAPLRRSVSCVELVEANVGQDIQGVSKKLYNNIPNVTAWRVLRERSRC
jgi:hypothetical protein